MSASPHQRFIPFDSWISGEMCSENCSRNVFSQMCFHEKRKQVGGWDWRWQGKMFSLTNPQSGKYDLLRIPDLAFGWTYQKFTTAKIISLIDDKIVLRRFFGLLSIRGAVYAVYGTGGRLLEWANCIFVTLISYLGINAERQCPSSPNVNFLSTAPAICCSTQIVIFILLPIKITVLIFVLCPIISPIIIFFSPSLFSIASNDRW